MVRDFRGRPRAEAEIQEVLDIIEQRGAMPPGEGQILDEMQRRHGRSYTRRQLSARLRVLRERGFIEARTNRVLQQRFAWLLLQVTDDDAPSVIEALGGGRAASPIRVTPIGGVLCDLVLRVRVVDERSVNQLCKRARSSGATQAAGLLEEPAARSA